MQEVYYDLYNKALPTGNPSYDKNGDYTERFEIKLNRHSAQLIFKCNQNDLEIDLNFPSSGGSGDFRLFQVIEYIKLMEKLYEGKICFTLYSDERAASIQATGSQRFPFPRKELMNSFGGYRLKASMPNNKGQRKSFLSEIKKVIANSLTALNKGYDSRLKSCYPNNILDILSQTNFSVDFQKLKTSDDPYHIQNAKIIVEMAASGYLFQAPSGVMVPLPYELLSEKSVPWIEAWYRDIQETGWFRNATSNYFGIHAFKDSLGNSSYSLDRNSPLFPVLSSLRYLGHLFRFYSERTGDGYEFHGLGLVENAPLSLFSLQLNPIEECKNRPEYRIEGQLFPLYLPPLLKGLKKKAIELNALEDYMKVIQALKGHELYTKRKIAGAFQRIAEIHDFKPALKWEEQLQVLLGQTLEDLQEEAQEQPKDEDPGTVKKSLK